MFPSSLGKLEDKVGAEGSGESQQVETGEYDHEACTLTTKLVPLRCDSKCVCDAR